VGGAWEDIQKKRDKEKEKKRAARVIISGGGVRNGRSRLFFVSRFRVVAFLGLGVLGHDRVGPASAVRERDLLFDPGFLRQSRQGKGFEKDGEREGLGPRGHRGQRVGTPGEDQTLSSFTIFGHLPSWHFDDELWIWREEEGQPRCRRSHKHRHLDL
jgi:hypothetical protein